MEVEGNRPVEFDPICIKGEPYVDLSQSSHQAMWILLREDVLRLNRSCDFLHQKWIERPNASHFDGAGPVREYMSSLSLYKNHNFVKRPLNCMVNKVAPATHLERLKIFHFYPSNSDLKHHPLSTTSSIESLRERNDLPDCWLRLRNSPGDSSLLH